MSPLGIVVVGASAGGVEALRTLVAGFPVDIRGAIFVVLHIGNNESRLPEILSAAGPLPAMHPYNGQPIAPGKIYVAPPDLHLRLDRPGYIDLSRGPKENRTRPAINPLFRSAAQTYGPDVIGVILSGALDDGVAGLAEIKRNGGVALVQHPNTALFPCMPNHAIEQVEVDYILPVQDMPELLASLVCERRPIVRREVSVEEHPSAFTCPECRGPISEYQTGNIRELRCRVGHAYSLLSFAEEHQATVERKLWEAMVALEESADIADRLGLQFGGTYTQQAKDRRKQAAAIKHNLADVRTGPANSG